MITIKSTTNQERETDSFLENIIAISAPNAKIPLGHRVTLANIVREIRSNQALKSAVAKVRAAVTEEQKRELKATTIPWFSLAVFVGNYRNKDNFLRIKHLVHDLDHLPNVADIKATLTKDPYVLMSFVSPSGKGLRVIYQLDIEIEDHEEYERVYTHYAKKFAEEYGIKPDPNGEKASQAWFYGYDPELYVNPNAKRLPVPEFYNLSKEKKPKNPPVISLAIVGNSRGERTKNLTRQIGYYMRHGHTEEDTLLQVREWNEKNNPPLPEKTVADTVRDMFKRYDHLPVRYFEKDGCYFKNVGKGKESRQVQISTFTIDPKELLVFPGSDCLRCNVTTPTGHTYENILIENTDWHSRARLLKALGHQDCSFLGSETEIQTLCSYVNANVKIRKTGTKTIGLLGDYWVTEGSNISVSGIVNPPVIVPYDKGADAFYHKIEYPVLSDAEFLDMAGEFYGSITKINTPEAIMPWIGWMFAAPLKPWIQKGLGGFPSVFVHGAQGSGKTSTALIMMKFSGYKEPRANVVHMKPFPMLKLLSSTNAVPVFLDEYKVHDMTDDQVDNIHRFIRKSYNSEVESKGRQDQTVEDYVLSAPMVVMGEWDINEPAIKERVLVVRFTNVVKKDQKMQEAYKKLSGLQLEGFMPRYVQYALSQDINALLEESMEKVSKVFENVEVAPRIRNNLSVMVAGLKLFEGFALNLGLELPDLQFDGVLKNQLKEITGSETGFVRSAVDQLIEELGIMWQKNEKQIVSAEIGREPLVKQVPWWKKAKSEDKDVIAIRFNKVFPEFKEYAWRTKYEGELLDSASYMKLFTETEYVSDVRHPVDFDGKKFRSLCIDINKATKAGVDLEGFGVTPVTQ